MRQQKNQWFKQTQQYPLETLHKSMSLCGGGIMKRKKDDELDEMLEKGYKYLVKIKELGV